MAAPVVITVAFTAPLANGDFNATLPAGVSAGDLLILAAAAWKGGGGNTIATPAGYTRIGTGASMGSDHIEFFWKVAGGGETNPLVDMGDNSGFGTAAMARVTGYTSFGNIAGPQSIAGGATVASPDVTPVGPVGDSELLAILFGESGVFATIESGWTDEGKTHDAAYSDQSWVIGSKDTVSLAADGCTWTFSPSLNPAGGITIEILGSTPCSPPVNGGGTELPTITGSLGVGNVLTAHDGFWTGDAVITFSHQWYRFCGTGPAILIGGATASTYTQQAADAGCDLFVRVTGSNGCSPDGVADSAMVGPVPTPAPSNVTPPTITGVTAAGHILDGDVGVWDFASSFSKQWYIDCGGGFVAMFGETGDSITTDDTEIGCSFQFGVIGHGAGGDSAEVFSATFGPIVANVPAAVRFYQSPAWRFVVLDRDTFEVLSLLDKLETERSVTFVLNQPAIHVGKVPSDEPEINIPWPGANDEPFMAEGTRTVLGLRREGVSGTSEDGPWVPRFHGFLEQLEDVAESDNAFSHLTAYDPLRYLMSRPVRNGAYYGYTLPGVNGSSYTATRIDVIIGEIIHNTIVADGPVGIDAGPLYGGTSMWGGTIEVCDQIDINFSQGTTVGEAIQQMTGTDEVDVLLLPIYDPKFRPGYLVELSIFNQAGAVIDDAIFAWDRPSHSLVGMSRLKDGTTRANKVKFFAGQGGQALNGQTIPIKTDAASVAKYGEYWYQQFWPAQNVAGAVELLAETQLALRKIGRTTVAISPASQRSPIPFQEYFLGDRVPVYASNRFREPIPPGGVPGIEYQRIYGIPISIADDQTETILEMLTSVQA